jgi:hypothetical protein
MARRRQDDMHPRRRRLAQQSRILSRQFPLAVEQRPIEVEGHQSNVVRRHNSTPAWMKVV